jgi:hypothetical protein
MVTSFYLMCSVYLFSAALYKLMFVLHKDVLIQGILKGEVSLYH